MTADRRQLLVQIGQCCLSIVVGCIVYLGLEGHPNPKVPLFGALICGVAAPWLLSFLLVWLRYGWRAARSISWGD